MNADDLGLIAVTGYVAGLISCILIDATQGMNAMNLKSALRALWHRLVPRRHKSADQLAREDLQRRLRWRVDSRLERAIRANRLALEDARAVRREYKRLAAKDDTEALTKAINYAAALSDRARAIVEERANAKQVRMLDALTRLGVNRASDPKSFAAILSRNVHFDRLIRALEEATRP